MLRFSRMVGAFLLFSYLLEILLLRLASPMFVCVSDEFSGNILWPKFIGICATGVRGVNFECRYVMNFFKFFIGVHTVIFTYVSIQKSLLKEDLSPSLRLQHNSCEFQIKTNPNTTKRRFFTIQPLSRQDPMQFF